MAKFGFNEAENYGGNVAGFFSLKDDGDSAIVRFMYDSIEDIEGYAVHRIEINGRNRYVNCLRNYDEPVDNCPLCASKNFQSAKFFFPLYNVDTEETQLWDRGKNIIRTLGPVLSSIQGSICGTPIKITRHGVAGDTSTSYSFEAMQADGCTMEDLPDAPDPMDNLILSYTFDELTTYKNTGRLPSNENTNDNKSSNYNGADNSNVIRRSYTPRNNTTDNSSVF